MTPEPTILELLAAYDAGVRGLGDEDADLRRGSVYDYLGGTAALIWSREAQRDTDLFNAIKFATASDQDLTEMGKNRYKIERILDTHGQGYAQLVRPSTANGTGTFWRGTRLQVSANGQAKYYAVAKDTTASGTAISVPIEAVEPGPAEAIDTAAGLSIVDPVWDASWSLVKLTCGPGTTFEPAKEYRTRILQTRRNQRVGQEDAITTACEAAGASHVALFRSDYAGADNDYGLNYCYVGDGGYTGTAKLIRDCRLALESVRVMGDNLQVLPMQSSSMSVDLTVTLGDPNVDLEAVRSLVRDTLVQHIGANGAFGYQLIKMAGSLYRNIDAIQDVEFTTPSSDVFVTSVVNGIRVFPPVLTRYFLTSNNITVTLA